MARLSRRFRFLTFGHWPSPRSLATTSGVSVDVLSSGYLDVSVRRVCLAILCIQIAITPKGWVSPFGNPRIKACSQLPVAYRSVLRPSSPLSAKASTKCPYALDCRVVAYRGKPRQHNVSDSSANFWLHKTVSASAKAADASNILRGQNCNLFTMSNNETAPAANRCGHETVISFVRFQGAFPNGRFHTADIKDCRKASRLWCRDPVAGGAGRNRTDDLLLAKQALSQLSYSPVPKCIGGPGKT